jgi:hypothetical protein
MRFPVRIAALFIVCAAAPAAALWGQTLPDHHRFTSVLRAVVAGDRVDYVELTRNRVVLREYLEALGRVGPRSLDAADRDSRLAFWVNAYHACLLELVVAHYPIEQATRSRERVDANDQWPANSVQRIESAFTRPSCLVALADRSLDEIVHQILRPMGDPRIHFALNCAAIGCPALASVAYTAADLDRQLEAAVRRFVSDPRHFSAAASPQARVQVNRMLEWFADDFGGEAGVRRFLAGYVDQEVAALLLDAETHLEYRAHDWALNDVERGG